MDKDERFGWALAMVTGTLLLALLVFLGSDCAAYRRRERYCESDAGARDPRCVGAFANR